VTSVRYDVVTSRNGLDAVMAALRPGDTLVVARLDRLGRSMRHLVATVHELAARGIGFKSLAESIDTTSAAGRLVLHIFASLADFERELIRERTRDALAAKKRRGEPVGRRRALSPSRVDAAREMLESGHGAAHVARILKLGRSTLYRALSVA
jgi:DNA invertase Pin-like site-specific DNA recombinase